MIVHEGTYWFGEGRYGMHSELLGIEVKCLGGGPRHPDDGHMSGRNMLVTTVQ